MDLQALKTALMLQKKNKVSTVILIAIVVLSACTQPPKSTLPYYNTPDFSPIWANEEKVDIDTLHTIAPFSFTNQNGQEVSNKTLAGKVYAANFFFTSCASICPKMTNNLQAVADSFAGNEHVNIVSYSVTPQTDNVATLKQYEQQNNINGKQWQLLTGDASKIYTLARKSYFAEEEPGYNKDSTEFLHTEHCILVDKKGHIRGVYNATIKLEIKRLIEDIGILLKEE
jgi:protein SCO1